MNKNEQLIINQLISNEKSRAELELGNYYNITRLRSCQAYVYETDHYYWLRSYGTFVAFIDKITDTCYDILRMVYGYTSTSAQHIAKFRHDYGQDKFGVHESYTWRGGVSMRYKVFMLRVKFERQTPKTYDFTSLEKALEAAWILKDCNIVEYINLKSEWRESPEWVEQVVRALAGLT